MLAVLPLRNLGLPEDEYFADGITEEILTSLAGFSGLGVISRTSAMQYKNTDKSLRQIGAELGVQYVLEGTIQWDKSVSPPRVRLHEQLIRVSDDVHLWGQRYDAVTNDIFEVQSTVAEKVVEALGVFLGERERQGSRAVPTDNPEAYDYYLRGLDYRSRGNEQENYRIAEQMFEKAVKLDPKFARAYTSLSVCHAAQYWFYYDRTRERLAKAKEAVDRAFQIEPDLPEAHMAMGLYYYDGYLDLDLALQHFRVAQEKLKDSAGVLYMIACAQRGQGRFQESLPSFQKAARLDPRSVVKAMDTASTFALVGNFEEAEKYYARAISMSPDSPRPYEGMVNLYLRWQERTEKARRFLESAPKSVISSLALTSVLMDLYDGNYQTALDRLSQYPDDHFESSSTFSPKDQLCAQIYGLMGNNQSEQASYESAAKLLEPLVKKWPDDWRLHSALGIAYAGLGRREEAVREGKLGVELLPIAKEAVVGLRPLQYPARIYVMLGEYDEALAQLESLLSLPGGAWRPLLRLDPVWKPLRDHPRFQELLRKYDSFPVAKPSSG
jgi:serine/threonine-protein kinase